MKYSYYELLLLVSAACFRFSLCLHDIVVTIQELEELNATCERETCLKKWESSYECNCGAACVQYGTCCLDSNHKSTPKPSIRSTCRDVGSSSYFLVDQCPDRGQAKSAFEDFCQEEWNGENDIMRLIPVTSLFSHISYKNYFCFKCHESHNDYVFWSITVSGESSDVDLEKVNVQLIYDNYYETWKVPVENDGYTIPVNITIFRPLSLASITKMCSTKITRVCSDGWQDDEVRAKCHTYMYLTTIERDNLKFYYKNPHCALCNFENLSYKVCGLFVSPVVAYSASASKPFSFTYLLDINRSDGDKVGKSKRCMSNDDVWDPFFKKCRTLTCATPTQTVQDGKCVST